MDLLNPKKWNISKKLNKKTKPIPSTLFLDEKHALICLFAIKSPIFPFFKYTNIKYPHMQTAISAAINYIYLFKCLANTGAS
jgi:hypothetical protein